MTWSCNAATSGKNTFIALSSARFRRYFFGLLVSMTGTFMQQTALAWLTYRLTGSATMLGMVGCANLLPSFFLAPVAGVIIERCDRRRLFLATQALALVLGALLALLALGSTVKTGDLLLISTLSGLLLAFDLPARQALLPELLDSPELLPNAIALSSMANNAARLAGPALAGVVIGCSSEGFCFLIDAASYLPILAALLPATGNAGAPVTRERQHPLEELKDALLYAKAFPMVRYSLLLVAAISLMAMPYVVLMPAFTKEGLSGTATTYGVLMGAVGLGSVACTFYLARKQDQSNLPTATWHGPALFGASVMILACTRSTIVAVVVMTTAGYGLTALYAASNMLLQSVISSGKRARVMSLYVSASIGMNPFGSLLSGAMASALGLRATLLVAGAACLLGALLLGPRIRERRRFPRRD